MDQLKGKVVNVVLTVQEGRGMETIHSPVFISANFNGRILESDLVPPEDTPCFNTNLIWEIEKRDLRKVRSSNQPLRLECITMEQNRRERYGHLLMDLRSAKVLSDDSDIPFKWQKLIAVRSKTRNATPELYYSLTIRSHLEARNRDSMEEVWEPLQRKEGGIPIKYLEDGFIMVGELNEANSEFSLNLLVKSASNLDLLLPEVLVFQQNKNKYCMSLKLFGVPIKTKQFSKDLHDTVLFDEKIVVRLLSNVETLEEFFKKEEFEVGFFCGDDILGSTTISFDNLSNNINDRIALPHCFFKYPSTNGIIPTMGLRRPALHLEMYLLQIQKQEPEKIDFVETSAAAGDHVENQLHLTETKIKELEEWKEKEQADFLDNLQKLRDHELQQLDEEKKRILIELETKQHTLDEELKKCKQLQVELDAKLEELRLEKSLKKKRKSCDNLADASIFNQKKFGDCDKELLIDYVTQLQTDAENLKKISCDQKQELDAIHRTALTKEQTANLLQELKGLEEKFAVAQQTKTYFKEQWQRACDEIHDLKAEDYKQLQDQLRERREELSQLHLDAFYSSHESSDEMSCV